MGKYLRKAKITSDVAVMELPQSSLGVRTRAKTLALQRLQATNPPPNPPANDSSYLQLRSRRLEKPNDSVKPPKSGAKESCRQNPELNLCPINPTPKMGSRLRPTNTGYFGSDSVSYSKKEKGCFEERILVASKEGEAGDYADLGVEASFGDNNLEFEFEGAERSTRESTPCSLIRGSDTIGTPGSSTRPTSLTVSNQLSRNSSMQRDIPTTQEMEEFFAFAEQQQQKLFTEKYNFDVVNDLPLPGRYEWVRVYPEGE